VYNSESADRDKCRMVTFASHRREADTTRTATLRDSILLLSKKEGRDFSRPPEINHSVMLQLQHHRAVNL
jgi:hypothetical protein